MSRSRGGLGPLLRFDASKRTGRFRPEPVTSALRPTRAFNAAAPYPRSRHSFMFAHSPDEHPVPVDTGSAAS